jgi:predicted SAM-dependent methyltransferase
MWLVRQLKHIRRVVYRIGRVYDRRYGAQKFRRRLAAAPVKRIVVGSSSKYDRGWIPTERDYLDLCRPEQWEQALAPNSLDALLAEHVWEHLTPAEALAAAATCYTYLKPGGYLRLAVPDGLHPSPEYIDWVKPGGASPGQLTNDHKVLYTYRTLGDVFESAGFRVRLYEYYDEMGKFHFSDWDPADGTIRRSRRFDRRNQGGKLAFTSVVLDAVKPGATEATGP